MTCDVATSDPRVEILKTVEQAFPVVQKKENRKHGKHPQSCGGRLGDKARREGDACEEIIDLGQVPNDT